jgi:uncharacterized protein (TIGR00255 family)
MSVKSMTGYGRAGFEINGIPMSIEASSVNRRGLEIFVAGPSEWTGTLERVASVWVREVASRGKVSLFFNTQGGASENALAWDAAALTESLQKLKQQAAALDLPFTPSADTLLHLAELHRIRRANLPSLEDESVQAALAVQARAVLAQLVAMRVHEGEFLAKDLLARLGVLEELLGQIERYAAGTVPRYRELLLGRLRQAGLDLDLNDERVLKEVALFSDRCDTAEEVTRLRSHFAQFRASLGAPQEAGRKLDFLCQEMNRELNTIGSKANHLEIARCVIEGKNELERIREQVQNVE